MSYPPLATAGDLAGMDGGPFTEKAVESAGAQIRRLAGWHIAPEVTETLTVDSHGGDRLWLPTRHVVDVLAVRDVTGDAPRELTGWRWSAAGLLEIRGRFPSGFRSVEVELVHGFDACPADLLPAVAD